MKAVEAIFPELDDGFLREFSRVDTTAVTERLDNAFAKLLHPDSDEICVKTIDEDDDFGGLMSKTRSTQRSALAELSQYDPTALPVDVATVEKMHDSSTVVTDEQFERDFAASCTPAELKLDREVRGMLRRNKRLPWSKKQQSREQRGL